MRYKQVGKNKYKRVKSILAGLILALLPLLVIMLVIIVDMLIELAV